MKIKDFIQEWVTATDPDTTVIIPTTEEASPNIRITTTGTSTIKHCYSWSCNERCLFYKDAPVCYKVHGILLCNEKDANILRDVLKPLGVRCYTFRNEITDYEATINKVLSRFHECAYTSNWLDDVILQFINSLNCKYENKYLNHCKSLTPDQFREVAKKHISRSQIPSQPKLSGLWYR